MRGFTFKKTLIWAEYEVKCIVVVCKSFLNHNLHWIKLIHTSLNTLHLTVGLLNKTRLVMMFRRRSKSKWPGGGVQVSDAPQHFLTFSTAAIRTQAGNLPYLMQSCSTVQHMWIADSSVLLTVTSDFFKTKSSNSLKIQLLFFVLFYHYFYYYNY